MTVAVFSQYFSRVSDELILLEVCSNDAYHKLSHINECIFIT